MSFRTLTMLATTTIASAQMCVEAGPANSDTPQPDPTRARLHWSQLPPLPDTNGVAGAFAGTCNGTLIVAGGANFPDRMPWEGGRKVWHDAVWALKSETGSWRSIGKLPRPLGYGFSASTPGGLLCVGGSDSERHHPDTFILSITGDQLSVKPLPPLPIPLANGAGAFLGSTAYLCCGSEQPGEQAATSRFFALDLSRPNPRWEELPPCPGEPRILPVAAAANASFYLIGGAALRPKNGQISRAYLLDAWRYDPSSGWHPLPNLPRPSVAAPSPAPVIHSMLLLAGGDDGSLAGKVTPEKHPGFPSHILALDLASTNWVSFGEVPASRATLPTVEWNGACILPSGEMRPGVRSPQVWMLRPDPSTERSK